MLKECIFANENRARLVANMCLHVIIKCEKCENNKTHCVMNNEYLCFYVCFPFLCTRSAALSGSVSFFFVLHIESQNYLPEPSPILSQTMLESNLFSLSFLFTLVSLPSSLWSCVHSFTCLNGVFFNKRLLVNT